MKKIRFKIGPEGEIAMDVEGTVGAECDAFTEPFESRLGTVKEKTRKDAFFETEAQNLETTSEVS